MQSLLRWQREGSILLAQQVCFLISDLKSERPFSITGFLAPTSALCCFAAVERSFICEDSLCVQSALSVKVIVRKMMQDQTLPCFNSHFILEVCNVYNRKLKSVFLELFKMFQYGSNRLCLFKVFQTFRDHQNEYCYTL